MIFLTAVGQLVQEATDSLQKPAVTVRWMNFSRDRQRVLAIEKENFHLPWSEKDFLQCLTCPKYKCRGGVAECNETVVGFMIACELSQRNLRILNLAVDRLWQGQGIGRQMLRALTNQLLPKRKGRITAHVHNTNKGAQLFFKAAGFKLAKIIHKTIRVDEKEASWVTKVYRLKL